MKKTVTSPMRTWVEVRPIRSASNVVILSMACARTVANSSEDISPDKINSISNTIDDKINSIDDKSISMSNIKDDQDRLVSQYI